VVCVCERLGIGCEFRVNDQVCLLSTDLVDRELQICLLDGSAFGNPDFAKAFDNNNRP